MGAYLSEPITQKNSEEGDNNRLRFASSEMQGWRVSQEDAHNAIPDFDTNTSLFAVYDGHGGSEVSAYCALKFPEFLKQIAAYKEGNFEKALQDAFLEFDATLLSDSVIEELKLLAKKNPEDPEEGDSDESDEENLVDLCQEAHMPLKEVLEKYKGTTTATNATPAAGTAAAAANPHVARVAQGEGSGAKLPISPYLRGRRADIDGGAGSSSSNGTGGGSGGGGCSSSSTSGPSTAGPSTTTSTRRTLEVDDATVSSSSSSREEAAGGTGAGASASGAATAGVSKKANEAESSDWSGSNGNNKNDIPDSSSTKSGGGAQAAAAKEVASVDSSEVTQSAAASASSKVPEAVTNGDVSGSEVSDAAVTAAQVNDDEAVIESSTAPTTTAKAEGVSSSSSSGTYENGEVSSNTNNGEVAASAAGSSSNNITSTEKVLDSSTDSSEDEANYEENSDTEDGEEDAGMEEIDSEEEDEDPILTEEDEEFMSNMVDEPGKDSGCTAVVALLKDSELYVANAGDSRCVVCRNGQAIEMSFDHKPEDQIEFDRIKNAGGRVTMDGRVNGGLNLSRAIGDHGYKMNKTLPAEKQMISALPDIKKLTITPEDEFMILACDGIWNYMTSSEAVEFVRVKLQQRPDIKLTQICEELFDHCLSPNTQGDGTGCDNMTAIIVQFKDAKVCAKRTVAEAEISDESPESNTTKRPKVDADPTQAPIVDTSS